MFCLFYLQTGVVDFFFVRCFLGKGGNAFSSTLLDIGEFSWVSEFFFVANVDDEWHGEETDNYNWCAWIAAHHTKFCANPATILHSYIFYYGRAAAAPSVGSSTIVGKWCYYC